MFEITEGKSFAVWGSGLRRRGSRPIRLQCLSYFCISIPVVIPFYSLFWVSLESLMYGFHYFPAFAKKTSRFGRRGGVDCNRDAPGGSHAAGGCLATGC